MRSVSPFVRLTIFLFLFTGMLAASTAYAQLQVFVWESPVNVDNVPCDQWTEPQIGINLERYTILTLGACPDYPAYGVIWHIKRSISNPLLPISWCAIGDDSTAPFSHDSLNLWQSCLVPQVGNSYDIAPLTTDQNGNTMTWPEFVDFAPDTLTPSEQWQWLIDNGLVKRFIILDTTPPVAHSLSISPDCTPDSSVVFVHGNVMLSVRVDDPDVVAVSFSVREFGDTDPWTVIERVEGDSGLFTPLEGVWNTELLNGTYVIGAFAEDDQGNIDGDLSGIGPGPTNTLTVNIDNSFPVATITAVLDENGQPVSQLERGSVVTFVVDATDNFGIREVHLYYRSQGGNGTWIHAQTIGENPDENWPYSFNWVVPASLVAGWTYDFAAVAADLCGQVDSTDAQGNAIVDGAWLVVDLEANIVIVTIGGQDALTTPHINGDNVQIVAHSEPNLEFVRFIWVRGNDTTEIITIEGTVGQTEWVVENWDVTVIDEGAAQVCAIGSADIGGDIVTIATDCRNIVIDHSIVADIGNHTPLSHGLVGGSCDAEITRGNVSIGLLMDYSGSMTEAVDEMEVAAHEFVTNMREGDRGAVIRFSDDVDVAQPFTDDLAAVDFAINGPEPFGATVLYDAVALSATLIQAETNRKAILLLTDGVDIGSTTPRDTAIARAVASGAPFFVIGLGLDLDTLFLSEVASQTGGELFFAPDPSDIAAIYEEIGQTIFVDVNQFDDLIIEFVPPSDLEIASVRFDYKLAADPDDPTFWHLIGQAVFDQLSGQWAYAWNGLNVDCGLITLRAAAADSSVPEPNITYVVFADSVRMDNCPPMVTITNVNGDVTPENTEIGQGQVAHIVASATDAFGNGGNSPVVRVDFFYTSDGDTFFIGTDANGEPWETYWNTGGVPFGVYTIHAIAYDEAGNCAETDVHVQITDQLYQRAWIVGYDVDNGAGCLDHIWSVTDDCPPNFTTAVRFQYTTDNGATWISLGEDQTGTPSCDEWLDYNIWSVDVEFDSIPAGAIFRAVATDESENDDPDAPRFRFSDVDSSDTPVVYNELWVRVPVTQGLVPWVFSTLEDYTEACPVTGALVCVEPVGGDPTTYAGPVSDVTSPCNLDSRDGQLTIFGGVPVSQGGFTYMQLTTYELNIHRVAAQGGSNGWMTSEDDQLELYVPNDGAAGIGTVWFEPSHEDRIVNPIPPLQSYYTLISEVENVMSDNLLTGTSPSHFQFSFETDSLPVNPEDWMVVAAYWDAAAGLWLEVGINYLQRDLQNGTLDFEWIVDWDVSDAIPDGCPHTARMAVFLTTSEPISEWVHFSSAGCPTVPDSTFYTVQRGPSTGCDPSFWAVLRQGEFAPPENTIDIYLDGIRIVNDGQSVMSEGISVFNTNYDLVSGLFTVSFNDSANGLAPWFGCLSAGQHYIQFFAGSQSSFNTPFYVDLTPPQAFTVPDFINQEISIWAELTDAESGIDTTDVTVILRNCLNEEPTLEIGSEAMTFDVIATGYRASFQLQWDQITFLFPDHTSPMQLCVSWNFRNLVCLEDSAGSIYIYAVDMEGPVVTPISPVGAGIDEDGDGLINEDPRDCINNDNDVWWDGSNWRERIDEDPVTFLPDTVNCGERPAIQAVINDIVACGSGTSGLDLGTFQLNIDGASYVPADTNNADLDFQILWPYNGDDAYFTFGGPSSGGAVDQHYAPGNHIITVIIADSAGNIVSPPVGWTYYVRCAGPIIVFEPTECGLWFNPEGAENDFVFCVEARPNVPIAPNGITYEVWTIPGGERISGPTVVDPAGQDSMCVTYLLGGSFPDGQTGIEVRVVAMDITANPEIDPNSGITRSNMTFWADNCAPSCLNFTPADGDTLSGEQPIVVEVYFTDDCPLSGEGNGGGAVMKVGRMDAKGKIEPISVSRIDVSGALRDQSDALDDNGSGINLACFDLNIYGPNGDVGPADTSQYEELDEAHAKFILPTDAQIGGTYTVNVTLCDCVGNFGGCTWQFFIRTSGAAPTVVFCPVETGDCQLAGFWNPDHPLNLCADILENRGINVNESGIRVDVLREYNCEGGLCRDTLVANAEFMATAIEDGWHVTAEYHFDESIVASQLLLVVTATDVLGQTTSRVQTWVVDGTPPIISIVSPLSNSVVSGPTVVISANFSDVSDDTVASVGGDKGFATKSQRPSGRFDDDESGSRLDDLDESGVDRACIELLLVPLNGDPPRNLTDSAMVTPFPPYAPTNITWSGSVAQGNYMAVLTVCDFVCNTTSTNWNFTVVGDSNGGGQPCFIFADPCIVSSPQHRIVFHRTCEAVDLSSLRLTLEGQLHDGNYITIIAGVPAQSAGDSSWYDATIPNIEQYDAIRLTLTGNFVGGAPIPTVVHLCAVDVFGPEITSVHPNPEAVLPGGSTPTFLITFEERGNSSLNGNATILRLTRGGEVIASEREVTIDPSGRSGSATLPVPEALREGAYELFAYVADVAGNSTTRSWTYRVGPGGSGSGFLTGAPYNWPNPFDVGDVTHFVIPVEGGGALVQISLYDFAGIFVTNLFDGNFFAGMDIIWNGTNDNGVQVANGVYLAHVRTNAGGTTRDDILKVAFRNSK